MTTNQNLTGTPTLSHVSITVDEDLAGIVVRPIWLGVDRPDTGGWLVKDLKIAGRLERAILAGAAFSNAEYAVDVAGQSYVAAAHQVMGRHMNADLKRLGF